MDKVLVGRRGKSHHNIANSSSRTLASALVSASAVANCEVFVAWFHILASKSCHSILTVLETCFGLRLQFS